MTKNKFLLNRIFRKIQNGSKRSIAMILVFVMLFSSITVTGNDAVNPASEVWGLFENVRFLLTFPEGTNAEDGAWLKVEKIHPDSEEYRGYTAAVKEGIDLRRESWAVEDGDFYSASIIQPDGSVIQPDRNARLEIVFPADTWAAAEPDNVRTVYFCDDIFEETQEEPDAAEKTAAPPMIKQVKDDGLHITFDLNAVYAFGVMKTQVPDGTPIEYLVPAEEDVQTDEGLMPDEEPMFDEELPADSAEVVEDSAEPVNLDENAVQPEPQNEVFVDEVPIPEEGIIPEENELFPEALETGEQWEYPAAEEGVADPSAAEEGIEFPDEVPPTEMLPEEESNPEQDGAPEEESKPEQEVVPEEESKPEQDGAPEDEVLLSSDDSDDEGSAPDYEGAAGSRIVPVEGADYEIRVDYTAEAGIPAEAGFEAKAITEEDKDEWLNYGSLASRAVILSQDMSADEADNLVIKGIFDLTIFDQEGRVIEPNAPVHVSVGFADAEAPQDIIDAYAVHFPGTGTTAAEDSIYEEVQEDSETSDGEIIEEIVSDEPQAVGTGSNNSGLVPEVIPTKYENGSVEFYAGGFSVYAVLTTTLSQTLTTSDGRHYRITVDYDSASGIPANAELEVAEIGEDTDSYASYVEKTAETLGKKADNLAFARAFDIKLADPESGKKFQPGKDVKVSVELLDQEVGDDDEISVVHFEEKAETHENADGFSVYDDSTDGFSVHEKEDLDGFSVYEIECEVKAGAVEFETDGFSVYVITGTNVPMWSFTFNVWNDTLGAYEPYGKTQQVKNREKPVIPQPVDTNTLEFAGWYETENTGNPALAEGDTLYNYDNIPSFTEDGGTTLYAKYTKYAYVVFHDQYDSSTKTWPVAYTRRAELTGESGSETATVRIDDVSASYTGSSNLAFLGWSETRIATLGMYRDPITLVDYVIPDTEITVDGEKQHVITVNGEKHLYPIYKSIHWLNYYTAQSGMGAAYVPSVSVFDGEGVSSPLPTTSREGYEFLGWYTGSLVTTTEGGNTVETVNYGKQVTNGNGSLLDESSQPYLNVADGGVRVSQNKLFLSADATLYAKWRAKYNVIIWKQNPNDPVDGDDSNNNYEYFTTITNTAEIGASVNFDGSGVTYDHYTFGHADGPKTIANTEDITVLNAYYDLTEAYSPGGFYTLTFQDSVEGSTIQMPDVIENISYGTSLSNYTVQTPADRTSDKGYTIYTFKGWYKDQACTVAADLSTMTMPDHNLTLYAGWEAEWFLVQIDPNYGALWYYDSGELKGTGATWFWQTYDDEPIGEYTHTTRDYVESSSGSYYYVNKNREYYGLPDEWSSSESGKEKKSYYTQNISEATEDTTFEYSADAYSYVGWYEVFADGSEAAEPYDFTQHTDHNTTLRLHWKKNGTYYLGYNSGTGDLDTEGTKTTVLSDGYSDYAGITLNRSAFAPTGYTFVGWQVRGDEDGQIYTPGQEFTLHADDAVRESGKDIVWLDAVYVAEDAVSIIYNVNGGTIVSDAMDYGKKPSTTAGGDPTAVGGIIDEEAGTVTVTDLTNNSSFILSNGAGFSLNGNAPIGWSTSPVYDPSTDTLYSCDGTTAYGVDTIGGDTTTLYAVWPVTVTYYLNAGTDTTAAWGTGWESPTYQHDTDNDTYIQTSYIGWDTKKNAFTGLAIDQPAGIPTSENQMFYYWATRSGEGTTESPYKYTSYDFSQPVTTALDLYAYWSGDIEVPIHAVDASQENLTEKTEWAASGTTLSVGKNPVDLTTDPESVTLPSTDYTYAFAVALSEAPTRDNVFESDAVASIYYNQAKKHLYVTYKDTTKADTSLDEGTEIYFIYYQKKSLNIGYKSMNSGGVLTDTAGIDAAAPTTTGTADSELLGTYDMTNNVSQPLNWAGSTTYNCYAFAIGEANAVNASKLKMTTATSTSDQVDVRPQLQVQNSWEGFRYSTDNGTSWTNLDIYTAQLYVVYYEQQPTIIMIHEKTVGTEAVMDTAFEYHIVVTQIEKDISSGVEATSLVYNSDNNDGSVDLYQLKNGEAQSAVLFYSNDGTTETTQTITVTQKDTTASANFTTKVGDTQTKVWSYTSSNKGGTENVTFTNEHKSLPVEVHVALLENGSIKLKDSYRNAESDKYSFDVSLGDSAAFLDKISSETIFTGPSSTYALGAILYGTDNGSTVTPAEMGISSVGYKKVDGNIYELLLDGDADKPLGEYNIYYLYYTMPQIQYMKIGSDGLLVNVQGSTDGSTTTDTITYNRQSLQMNQVTVEQGQKVTIPVNDTLVIRQAGNNFRMPGNLDDGIYRRYLSYTKLGAGDAGKTDMGDIAVDDGLKLYIRLTENALEYSFTGDSEDYTAFSNSGTPTIYAIYEERGYDLMLTKTIDTSASGANPLFTEAKFTVTITSDAITKSSYDAVGYENATIPADPDTHTITLTDVGDGMSVRIKGLGQGEYTITEIGNENYDLTAKYGTIVSGATETAYIEALSDGSGSVVKKTTDSALVLDSEMRVDLTNTPQKLCKIVDDGTEHVFYTFADAIEYVENNIANRTATIEMLSDYLVPAEDALEIPYGYNITLTTASSGTYTYSGTSESGAVLTRSQSLAAAPVITNIGSLSMTLLNIDGASLAASAPLIQSSGDLTVGTGATLYDAVNSGNGGAINATDGDITIDDGAIKNNQAASGAAVYYTGSGTISMLQNAEVSGNESTGDGGAIYAAQGTISLSGSATLKNNTAEGNGGAIHAGNIIISIGENAQITGNDAQAGGAIYADTATITVTEKSGINPPSISNNTASSGDGGAINVGAGSITISGGSITGNTALSGNGGAIRVNTASVEVSGNASFGTNKAQSGGAIYAQSGMVTVSGGSMSGNEATSADGGAIYDATGNVVVTGSSLTGNKANSGNGGAVYAGSGTVSVTDAEAVGNSAKNGGAVYANTGAITISGATFGGTESGKGNTASISGGAIYAAGGSVTVTNNSNFTGNTAATNGGAIYAGTGAVSVTGGSITSNTTTSGKGGAIYAESGNVGLNSVSVTSNNSASDGGVVYAGSGAVMLTSCTTVTGNTAMDGNGGVVCANSGSVTISGSNFGGDAEGAGNSAKNGGVVYSVSGTVSVTGGTMAKNTASSGDGGAIRTDSGNVTLSDISMTGNNATNGNGGALYVNSGTVSVTGTSSLSTNSATNGGALYLGSGTANLSTVTMTGNTATENGGAAYADSGNLTLSGGSMSKNTAGNHGGAAYAGSGTLTVSGAAKLGNANYENANQAKNGAAVYIKEGTGVISGNNTAIQYNIATSTDGGAVGVGDDSARLFFSDNVTVRNNRQQSSSGSIANVCLDQDLDTVINTTGLGGSAEIGIYVPGPFDGELFKHRGAASALFASYTSTNNLGKFKNDRNTGLTAAQADNNKVRWVKTLTVEVRYLGSFENGFPPTVAGTTLFTLTNYVMPNSENGASQVAADIYANYNTNQLRDVYPNAGFACAFMEGETDFGKYLTEVNWNGERGFWQFIPRGWDPDADPAPEPITGTKIIVYFSQAAYLSVVNNTEENLTLNLSKLEVLSKNVITDGYGYITASNGQTVEKLVPITNSDLTIPVGHSIKIVFPGAAEKPITIEGSFSGDSVPASVAYKVDGDGHTLSLNDDHTFTLLDDENHPYTLPTDGNTREILFGEQALKICEIIEDDHSEWPTLKAAKDRIVALHEADSSKTVFTIAMLVDYLQPPNDVLEVPDGYDITLTTSSKYDGDGEVKGQKAATLSRDAGNLGAMIKSDQNNINIVSNAYHAAFRIENLIMDGRALVGSGDGGALKTKNATVSINNVYFKGFEATNGGALYVDFDTSNTSTHAYQQTTGDYLATMTVTNTDFLNCRSSSYADKTGGGSLWTTARVLTLDHCNITGSSCYRVNPEGANKGTAQAGAIFHNINMTGRSAYSTNSHTYIRNCNFKDCYVLVASGGAVESDALDVVVEDCMFDTCYVKSGSKNGGGLNIYANNSENPNVSSKTTIRNTQFINCSSTNNGGAFRTTSEIVTMENVTFSKCKAKQGGAFAATGNNAKTLTINGSSFDSCSASNQGGGIWTNANKVTINDYTYGGTVTHSSFTNCQSTNEGGGIFHNGNNSEFVMANATVNGNSTTAGSKSGGGIYTKAKTVEIIGGSISNNIAKGSGGGICQYNDRTKYSIDTFFMTSTTVSGNTTTDNNTNGGGIYTVAKVVSLTNGTISGNTAKSKGGGIYTDAQTSLTIEGTEIKKNTSSGDGGGVWYDGADDTARGKMTLTLKGGSIDNNTATNGNGGGVFTQVRTVNIGDSGSAETSVSNNKALNGGGVYHKLFTNAVLTVTNARIDGNSANGTGNNGVGGGLRTNANTLTITNSSISHNGAANHGGGVWYDGADDVARNSMSLAVSGSTIGNNTSSGSGGGVYTMVKIVTIGDYTYTDTSGNQQTKHTSVSNNTSKNSGGGIYHKSSIFTSNTDKAMLTITNASIDGNEVTASNQLGGGVYTTVRALSVTGGSVSNNTSLGNGGGIWYDGDEANRDSMSLAVSGCTINGNTSSTGSGGGIYTQVKTAVIGKNTNVRSSVSNNTAAADGGGIYCSRNTDGASIAITGTDINENRAGGTNGGGGVYANIKTASLVDVTLQNNQAVAKGGGILSWYESTFDIDNDDPNVLGLIVDSSTLSGNVALTGGGIYSRSFVRLRNGSSITGNMLSSGAAENAAGVYLENDKTLVIGIEGYKDTHEADTVIIKDNKTNGGLPSNLRLWSNSDGQNNNESVYVYCNLSRSSEVRVVNANKVGTWFGSSAIENPIGFTEGFTEDFSVFRADYDTLHGVIDRSESSFQHIIWAGPAVCKITDSAGTLLYLRQSSEGTGSDPAIFDRLDNGNESDVSITSAFSLLRAERPELYYADGTPYYGPDYCVKMLDSFTTESPIIINVYQGTNGSGETQIRNITLTTAGRDDADYPYEYSKTVKSRGNTATVLRGTGVGNNVLLNTKANLSIENIILDGGSLDGITAQSNTRILNIDQDGATVNLKSGASLQNAQTTGNGGGVYVNHGTLVIGDDSTSGVIRNCNAANGGAVYTTMYAIVNFNRGNIIQCTAANDGGGVYLQGGAGSGEFTMNGGSIERCTAENAGGGVFVGNSRAFHMSGTSSRISRNSAGSKGGGIAIGGSDSRIYFSVMPTVTANTCTASVADNNICNVELDKATTAVINTEKVTWNGREYNGLINGANIGVYVSDENSCYNQHGVEGKPFGTYEEGNNTKTFYSFVNDRNGLKGGLMSGTSGNHIYWVKIFSLEVSKFGENLPSNEIFEFEVRLEGEATVTGQPDAKDIDGEYGNMTFHSDGTSSTTAIVKLKLGEGDSWETGVGCIGENLSDGLIYTVTERLTEEQAKKYAASPAQYTGVIGENNKSGVNVAESERYISRTRFENVSAVCKLTDGYGNLLYYVREGAKDGEARIPAVYNSIKAATDALSGTLYSGVSPSASSYTVSGGVRLQMLVGSYTMLEAVTFPADVPITLTTASSGDEQYPYRGAQGTVSAVTRGFTSGTDNDDDHSMFVVLGNLTVNGITLDGAKSTYSNLEVNGGIFAVEEDGSLTIGNSAQLQSSKVTEKGGAVYVASGGTLIMTSGTIQLNEALYGGAVYVEGPTTNGGTTIKAGKMTLSGGTIQNNKANITTNGSGDREGNGAGIYLANGSTLELSGAPSFGTSTAYNSIYKDRSNVAGDLTGKKNGDVTYQSEHQDIYLEETGDNPASIKITGTLTGANGSIWVWAASDKHNKTMTPFAVIDTSKVSITDANRETVSEMFKVFRNALPDDDSDNPISQTPKYLYGMLKDGDNNYVYWYGIEGSRKVILRKVDSTYASVSGKTFNVYKGTSTTAYEVKDKETNTSETLNSTNLQSLDSGVFWIGTLPYGWYIIEETDPHRYFYLVVTENGTYGTLDASNNNVVGGYETRDAANTAATNKYNELK